MPRRRRCHQRSASKALKRIADLSELALTNKQAAEHRHHVKRYLKVDDDVAWQALKRIADGHGSEVSDAAQSSESSTYYANCGEGSAFRQ